MTAAPEPDNTVADRRVHPATIPLRFLKEAPSTLLGLPAAYAFISDKGLSQILFFAAAISLAAIVHQWLRWRRFRYGIGERELVIESGILSRTRRSIPFARIQDVDIERGPLARLFGLAKLRIETGGSGKDEGVLDSVTVAEAERIRAALRGARASAAPEAEAEEPERQLLFAMSVPRVLAAGLFNFSMVYLASLFAFLQTFDNWLPFDIYDPGRWIGLVDQRLSGRLSFGAIAAVALVAVVLGVVVGVARTLARDFGFRLSLEPLGLRRERGLFTRSEVMLPKRRIQLAILQTGPLRRWLGWYELGLQTLSASAGKASARQTVAPLARAGEAEHILAAQGELRTVAPSELTMVSSRHFLRRALTYCLVPLLLIVSAGIIFPPAWTALSLLPFLLPGAYIERRFHRYGLSDGLLFVQSGMWRQRQWVVPVGRVQSLRLSRSWLQRRLGLATLWFDTAGAPALDPVRIMDVREGIARDLMKALSAR
jgi:putative membrane protein